MNIFKQFIKSLYSPKDIASFRFQGIGKTILYVFFLTLLSILPTVYFFSFAIVNGINAVEESINIELPDFQIEDGELHSEQNAPITINKDRFTVLFDSTGTIEKSKLSNSDNTIALLKDEFIFTAGGQQQSYSYSMLNNVTITKQDLADFLSSADSMLMIIIPLMAVVIYIFTVGMRFIEVSILALIGLLLKNIMDRKNIQYRHLWRISAYSVTLPTIFFTIMAILKTAVPNGAFINWFVAFMIIFLAIKEIPQPKKQ